MEKSTNENILFLEYNNQNIEFIYNEEEVHKQRYESWGG